MEKEANAKELKDRIYTLRKTLNLSMEKFGNRLAISKSSISGFEKGTTNPFEGTRKAAGTAEAVMQGASRILYHLRKDTGACSRNMPYAV